MSDPKSISAMREYVAGIDDLVWLASYARALDGTTALPEEYRRAAQEAIRARRVELMKLEQKRGRR